jgi:hypothetical protein
MKNVRIILIWVIGSLFAGCIYSADRVVKALKIPDRDPAPKERHYFKLTPPYRADMVLLTQILDALCVAHPEALRALKKKCKYDSHQLSGDVRGLLSNLKFFDERGRIKEGWKPHILELYERIMAHELIEPMPIMPAEREQPPAGCWSCLSTDYVPNPEFIEQVTRAYRILKALKIVAPDALRELYLMFCSPHYRPTAESRYMFLYFGFLSEGGHLRAAWRDIIFPMFAPEEDDGNLLLNATVEDIARHFGDAAYFRACIERGHMPDDMLRILNSHYPGLFKRVMSGEERAAILLAFDAHQERAMTERRFFTTVSVTNLERNRMAVRELQKRSYKMPGLRTCKSCYKVFQAKRAKN